MYSISRRLSTQLNTRWTEYWNFLNDFLDLRSDYGLHALNNYLSSFYQEENDEQDENLIKTNEKQPCCRLFPDDQTVEMKKTPTKRHKPIDEVLDTQVNKWTTYRANNNPTCVLNDSFDETSSSSSANSSLSDRYD